MLYVAHHSIRLLPLPYRIAAVWGGHEGSAAALGADARLGRWPSRVLPRQLPDAMVAACSAVLGLVTAGFLLFILLTSNPFDACCRAPKGATSTRCCRTPA